MKQADREKEKKQTIDDVAKRLQVLEKLLSIECSKCEGTGEPRTKTGEPPKTGKGNVKCTGCDGTGTLGSKIRLMENKIETIKKDMNKIASNLKAHINKQSVEIRVLPENGDPSKLEDWQGYSGTFDLEMEEEKEFVLGKAMHHFDTYFKDSVWHRNKRLGVFLTNATGRHFVEEIETGE